VPRGTRGRRGGDGDFAEGGLNHSGPVGNRCHPGPAGLQAAARRLGSAA
jgi:hypothetical protein